MSEIPSVLEQSRYEKFYAVRTRDYFLEFAECLNSLDALGLLANFGGGIQMRAIQKMEPFVPIDASFIESPVLTVQEAFSMRVVVWDTIDDVLVNQFGTEKSRFDRLNRYVTSLFAANEYICRLKKQEEIKPVVFGAYGSGRQALMYSQVEEIIFYGGEDCLYLPSSEESTYLEARTVSYKLALALTAVCLEDPNIPVMTSEARLAEFRQQYPDLCKGYL